MPSNRMAKKNKKLGEKLCPFHHFSGQKNQFSLIFLVGGYYVPFERDCPSVHETRLIEKSLLLPLDSILSGSTNFQSFQMRRSLASIRRLVNSRCDAGGIASIVQ